MTLYLIGGAVFFIVMVYFYAKNQGFKDAALDYLESGVETANKVDENDKAKDKEIDAKLEQFSCDNALDFWVRKDNSKKSENLSNSKET